MSLRIKLGKEKFTRNVQYKQQINRSLKLGSYTNILSHQQIFDKCHHDKYVLLKHYKLSLLHPSLSPVKYCTSSVSSSLLPKTLPCLYTLSHLTNSLRLRVKFSRTFLLGVGTKKRNYIIHYNIFIIDVYLYIKFCFYHCIRVILLSEPPWSSEETSL